MNTQDQNTPTESIIELNEFAERLASRTRDQSILIKNLFSSELIAYNNNRSIRFYILNSDRNNRPQVGLLVRELYNSILEYCIPRKQIDEALKYFDRTHLTTKILALQKEAQQLFTDISNTGEGGELLLFILTESVLEYPQALSKMALKTSNRMHYHGLDGIYISCKGNPPTLRLHFGESKLHKDPTSSVREAINSIADMLLDEGFIDSARRDYYLLNSQADLGSIELEEALKAFLDPQNVHFMAPEVCAILLSGHELENYPVIHTNEPFPENITANARRLVEELEINALRREIESFHIDLFLIPFPNIQSFRDMLLQELGHR